VTRAVRRKVAILISGGGSNMLALARDMADPGHPAETCLVLANQPGAAGLERAAEMGIATACVDHRAFADRASFETAMMTPLRESGAEILCLAGFMRVLTPAFIEAWAGRLLNIHPSILPLFPGLHTHARCLSAGMAVHGCTVHEVTPDLDAGPILGQAVVPVLAGDTAETLAARVLPMEHRLYPAVLRQFVTGERAPLALLA
jgi:phosphoribosylglycinamide formyltransferase 1